MENQKINQQFREDEIAFIKHWNKERQEYITNAHPKISGRLRLAHEENEALSIETEIVKYDESIAVVSALCKTGKGSFKGIGMASTKRDPRISPAILELAETRAIARSLRFAGYGVEFCSAEEMSHLGQGNGHNHQAKERQPYREQSYCPGGNGNGNFPTGGARNGGNGSRNYGNGNGGNGNGHQPRNSEPENGNGNGNGRLTSKQYNFILKLNEQMGRHTSDLDKQCQEMFGTVAQHLSKGDASQLIENLLGQYAN